MKGRGGNWLQERLPSGPSCPNVLEAPGDTPNTGNYRGDADMCLGASTISLDACAGCANWVGFRGLVPLLPHLSVPEVGVCMWGIFGKPLKRAIRNTGSACCADDMFEIFVRFGRCLCCLLPLFVNRQPPCPHTNSFHGLLLPLMHHRNLGAQKGSLWGSTVGARAMASAW